MSHAEAAAAASARTWRTLVATNVVAWGEFSALFAYATWAAVVLKANGENVALAIWAYVTTTTTASSAYYVPSSVIVSYTFGLAALASIYGIYLGFKALNLGNLVFASHSMVDSAFALYLHPVVAYGYYQDFEHGLHTMRWLGGLTLSGLLFVLMLPYIGIANLGTIVTSAASIAVAAALFVTQEAAVVQAGMREADYEKREQTYKNREDLPPPTRTWHNMSWSWFTIGVSMFALFTPIVNAYVPFLLATPIYAETDGTLRGSFLAIFWAPVCLLVAQAAFFVFSVLTQTRFQLAKEVVWSTVLNPGAAAVITVFLVRWNAAGPAADLQATLIGAT
jgi:hypothetical protein